MSPAQLKEGVPFAPLPQGDICGWPLDELLHIPNLSPVQPHVSHSLNSLKGITYGSIMGAIKGDARSLDCSSHQGMLHSTACLGCRSSGSSKIRERYQAIGVAFHVAMDLIHTK